MAGQSFGINRLMSRVVVIAIAVLAIALAFGLMGAGAQRAYATDDNPSVDVTRAATGKLVMKKGSIYKLSAKAGSGKLTYKSSKNKQGQALDVLGLRIFMVGPAGLEPATKGL